MARKPRVWVPGGIYHVTQRGVQRRTLFVDQREKLQFLKLLDLVVADHGHRCFGYCLMTNHIHLLIQCGDEPLAAAMKRLFGRYAQWFNRRHSRVGHLYQERHKALLVDTDAYLKSVIRYLHLNPVEAKIVQTASAYRWSSHRDYLGLREAPEWLTTAPILSIFGDNLSHARERFREFVEGGGTEIPSAVTACREAKQIAAGELIAHGYIQQVLSSGAMREHNRYHWTMEDAILEVCKELELTQSELTAPSKSRHPALGRAMLALKTRRLGSWTMNDLAKRVGRDYSALSRAASQFEAAMKREAQLANLWERTWSK